MLATLPLAANGGLLFQAGGREALEDVALRDDVDEQRRQMAIVAATISGPQLVPPSRLTNSCIPTGSVFISRSLATRRGQRYWFHVFSRAGS